MTTQKPIEFSKDELESLEHLSDLLHLFYHRNKNQHRRSIWWRHFAIFRRQLNGLIEEVRSLHEVPTSHLGRTRKKAKDKETQTEISERLDFWKDVLVPKWQNAFSQIIADGRFGVLGLVLLATLAQVCQLTGITVAFDDMGQAEVEKVLEQFGKEHWEDASDLPREPIVEGEDLGEVVLRDEQHREDGIITPLTTSRTLDSSPDSVQPRQVGSGRKRPSTDQLKLAKKKRKKGNAIDDLFSGLN